MDAFALNPPEWTTPATHAASFCCPKCGTPPTEAESAWINRRSPVFTLDHQRKWQEFYQCPCGWVWWAWSNDRPPNDFDLSSDPPNPPEFPRRDDDLF